jgi:hypothetical protein
MNTASINLGGFFDVNRTLFKSVRRLSDMWFFFSSLFMLYILISVTRNDGNIFGCSVTVSNKYPRGSSCVSY